MNQHEAFRVHGQKTTVLNGVTNTMIASRVLVLMAQKGDSRSATGQLISGSAYHLRINPYTVLVVYAVWCLLKLIRTSAQHLVEHLSSAQSACIIPIAAGAH